MPRAVGGKAVEWPLGVPRYFPYRRGPERAPRRKGRNAGHGRSREAKAEAMRAMRVLEIAVGVALGPAVLTQAGPGRGKPSRACEGFSVSKFDRHRFRLMAERRDAWWHELAERPLSRKQVRGVPHPAP